jgi:hypothetical protein
MSDVPVVAPRNDPPKVDIYSRSRAHEIEGKNPGFHYEYFSQDPKHPSYVGNRLRKHEIGDPQAGYAMVDAWEVVHDGEVQQGRKRADDTKGVDTTVTHGGLILCRTPKENHAKYQAINDRRSEQSQRMLTAGEKSGNRFVSLRTRVAAGFGEDGVHETSTSDLLGAG